MIIRLNEDFRVRSDPFQWVLEERKTYTRKEDKVEYEKWHSIGFFNTLEGTLQGLIEYKVRFEVGEYTSDALEPLLRALESFKEQVREGVKEWMESNMKDMGVLKKKRKK